MKTVLLFAFAVAVVAFAQFHNESEARKVAELERTCSAELASLDANDGATAPLKRNLPCLFLESQVAHRSTTPQG
ncbi:hypothetical protein EGJ28_16305 [Stutzerimonas xanthomarina]|jgi:hypothetical protein|uniref:Uncharacterized protein n=1 Tax=Stutzerimonas xanthomarina TaxID=271420 RepID=A0A427DYI1_9GAMM|nr:hypothetical protein EGJ28_16305 [Stutzerimonas xanthomarina]